jgi:signal transduction histidine kinase
LTAITAFETERYPDKRKVKELTGRLRNENSIRTVFSRNMAMLSNTISNDPNLSAEIKLQAGKLIDETRAALNSMLEGREQPLLVAASIGITYMMPTHEARRELHEAMKLLRTGIDSKIFQEESARPILLMLRQVDETIQGIGRLMQQTSDDEVFKLETSIDDAIDLMRFRFKRNSIVLEKDIRIEARVKGSERLVTIMLLNLLDNSLYWLLRKKPEERRLKLVSLLIDGNPAIIVSDSGPGFCDDINTLTLPFFTRKPKGMGLGLYISDRIAKMNGGRLRIIDSKEFTDLHIGANIAIIFKETKEEVQ